MQSLQRTFHLSINILAILWIARYYGLYSSRTKGKAKKVGNLVKFGYNPAPAQERAQNKDSNIEMETVSSKASGQSWARLIQKVYEVDPLVCPKCGHAMKVISVVTDPSEVNKIMECLKRNNAPPFDKEVTKAS